MRNFTTLPNTLTKKEKAKHYNIAKHSHEEKEGKTLQHCQTPPRRKRRQHFTALSNTLTGKKKAKLYSIAKHPHEEKKATLYSVAEHSHEKRRAGHQKAVRALAPASTPAAIHRDPCAACSPLPARVAGGSLRWAHNRRVPWGAGTSATMQNHPILH